METSVAYKLHGGLSQPRSELCNPGDRASLTQFKSVIHLVVGVCVNLDSLGFALCVQFPYTPTRCITYIYTLMKPYFKGNRRGISCDILPRARAYNYFPLMFENSIYQSAQHAKYTLLVLFNTFECTSEQLDLIIFRGWYWTLMRRFTRVITIVKEADLIKKSICYNTFRKDYKLQHPDWEVL